MSIVVWEELVATALLGTERRPAVPPPAGDDALARALGTLPWDDAEGALLGAAGLLAGYRAAGWQPPALEDAPSPAPGETRPLCGPGAAAILARLLESGPAHLLPEWLRLARDAGVRPPPELLPALLDAGASTALRAPIIGVGGERMRWLAALDDRWSWAASAAGESAAIEERWQTGTRDERLALLHDMRSEDPDRARALVEATWSADGAQERAALVAALATGLQPADEPFLEAALDDRSRLVRAQAAQLLASLPSSALAGRMAQRLRALVTVGGRLRRKLEVQTPGALDDAARRDGLDDAGRPHGLGAGAWRLAQIVGAAPLAVWQELTGADAEATLALARGADHEPAFMLGWGLAARRQRDPRWSAVLARATGAPELLEALAPGAGDDVALALLEQAPDARAVLAVLERIPAPWSAALSRAAIAHLSRTLSVDGQMWGIRLAHVALALDLRTSDHAATAVMALMERDLQPAVRLQLHELLQSLDLRHAMTRELTQP